MTTLVGSPENHWIEICERKCVPRVDLSNGDVYVCEVPSLPSFYTVKNFNIKPEIIEIENWVSKTGLETSVLTDGDIYSVFDATKNENCELVYSLDSGYALILSELEFYVPENVDLTIFKDQNLTLWGSNSDKKNTPSEFE